MHNMWTEITRAQYRRDELRYASDTRAAEWAQIAPLLPAPRRLGRPRQHDLRTIIDAILYLLWTGCQVRALPREFPPRSTVQGHFYRWRGDRTRRARLPGGPPADGWSNAPSPGSAAADAWPKTSRRQSPVPPLGCSSPTSACSPDASQQPETNSIIPSQTLRSRRRRRLEGG